MQTDCSGTVEGVRDEDVDVGFVLGEEGLYIGLIEKAGALGLG